MYIILETRQMSVLKRYVNSSDVLLTVLAKYIPVGVKFFEFVMFPRVLPIFHTFQEYFWNKILQHQT